MSPSQPPSVIISLLINGTREELEDILCGVLKLPIFKVQLLNDLAEPPVVALSTLEGPVAFYQCEIPKLKVQLRLRFVKLANLNGVYRASAVKCSRSPSNLTPVVCFKS